MENGEGEKHIFKKPNGRGNPMLVSENVHREAIHFDTCAQFGVCPKRLKGSCRGDDDPGGVQKLVVSHGPLNAKYLDTASVWRVDSSLTLDMVLEMCFLPSWEASIYCCAATKTRSIISR